MSACEPLQRKVATDRRMRKLFTFLNAMVKHHTRWQPQEVPSA